MEKQYIAKAFVSCSLRPEDELFVDSICKILQEHNIKPFGTVGKFSASPQNPIVLMKENIDKADMVIICATPRYFQKDLKNGDTSYGLPEMVHVEAGMAFMANKPVVTFVKQGTHIGSFIPNLTQYIELSIDHMRNDKKNKLIKSLLVNACEIITKIRNKDSIQKCGKLGVGILAAYGGYKILENIFSDSE